MFVVPIALLAGLLIVVIAGNSMKKKGSLTESTYQTLVSVSSVIVTIAALIVMYRSIRG